MIRFLKATGNSIKNTKKKCLPRSFWKPIHVASSSIQKLVHEVLATYDKIGRFRKGRSLLKFLETFLRTCKTKQLVALSCHTESTDLISERQKFNLISGETVP
jgi:hypothetical protein